MIDTLLSVLVGALVRILQALPLSLVARIGRAGGALGYLLDARHRRVARLNLALSLGQERSPAEILALARENFRRLGENYCSAIKTAAMPWEELSAHVEFVGGERAIPSGTTLPPRSVVVAIGHFGNFELYARFSRVMPRFRCGTTYRGLRQPSLDRLLQHLREGSGDCDYFERRTEAGALKAWMQPTGRILGLLADQHAGTGGVRIPFFGRECSTTASPAVFALRYDCALHSGICYRIGLARWRIELGEQIPTHQNGKPREIEAITRDVNAALEAAVRRDPANWFWVHNRWKPDKPRRAPARRPAPVAPATGSTET